MDEDLRLDLVEAVKYTIKLVLTEDPYFASKMKIKETFLTSFTDAVVSKGKIMTSIEAHFYRTFVDEIRNVET